MNHSSRSISPQVLHILQLGDNFALPYKNKNETLIEMIKNIENNIKKLQIPTQNVIRNHSIPIVNNFISTCLQNNGINQKLYKLIKLSTQFLKDNQNLILTKADKSNITAALDKTDYINKINQMLQDTNTYAKIIKNSINKMVSNIKSLLIRWKRMDYISLAMYRLIYCSDGILPRAYGLPKVHKPDCQFRVIISSIDSQLHSLAFFHNFLTQNNQ